MSLESQASRMPNYVGDGIVTVFAYTFKIIQDSDLRVTTRDLDGVETQLVLGVDYTVTGAGLPSGGDVELATPLAEEWLLSIRRVRPLTQLTDIRNQGTFYPEIHEDQFDSHTMVDQAQQDEIDRSFKLPETVEIEEFDPRLPTALVGASSRVLMTNADGDGLTAGPTASQIVDAESQATAAAASAVASAASATAASASATAAASSASAASTSASAAATSAQDAEDAAASVGLTVTGSRASPIVIANGGTLTPLNRRRQKIYVAGSGGPATLGSIADGFQDGDELMIVCCSTANGITIPHGINTKLAGDNPMEADYTTVLSWDLSDWVEVSRSI